MPVCNGGLSWLAVMVLVQVDCDGGCCSIWVGPIRSIP